VLKRLKNNLGYKIVAFVLAFLFWFVVYNSNNPIVTVKFTVPITILHQTSPQLYNLRIVNDYDKQVVIEVRGRESEIAHVNAIDFEVEYDFSKIHNSKTTSITYDNLKYMGDRAINYSVVNNGKINLIVEDLSILIKKIDINLVGKPSEGYTVINTMISPENFTIKDVKSIVSKIAKAIVTVDVEGIKGNTSLRQYCEFYDKNGDLISELGNYLYIDIDIEVAKELEVETTIIGIPDMDYQVIDHYVIDTTVKVSGPEEQLQSLEKLETESISVSGKTKSFTTKAAVINLPIGCKLVGSSNEVEVLVTLQKLETKQFVFKGNEIKFIYKDNYGTYSYSVMDDTITFTLKGLKDKLNLITKDMLAPYIDVKLLTDTIISLPVEIQVPNNIKQVDYPTAEVKIVKNLTLQISSSDINIINARYELYNYSFKSANIPIVISGFSEYLNDINSNSLNPYIDVKDLKEGTHQVMLSVNIPENVEMPKSIIIDVVIEKK